MTDFTNATSQTLSNLRSAEDTLNLMLWNTGDIVEKISAEQISREQIDPLIRSFSDNAQSVQQLLHNSISNLERISSGLPHEDSCYGSWLDFNLAFMRTETTRNQLFYLKTNQFIQTSRERIKQLEIELTKL